MTGISLPATNVSISFPVKLWEKKEMGGCAPNQTETLQEACLIRDKLIKPQANQYTWLIGQIDRNLKRTHQIDDL